MAKVDVLSCTECGQLNCYRHQKKYPDFCLSEAVDDGDINRVDEFEIGFEQGGLDARQAVVRGGGVEIADERDSFVSGPEDGLCGQFASS